MDSDFSEKLKRVLSDPEAMSKITAIASGLGATAPSNTAPDPAPDEMPKQSDTESAYTPLSDSAPSGQSDALPALMQGFNTSGEPRLLLLSSLKPLLREDKREKIDALTKALAIASMMKNLRK